MSDHAHLLSPGRIGPIETRNRIVMPAMDQNLCTDDGLLTEANIDHYEQRARGGAGLLVVETSAVAYPFGATSRHQPALSTDGCIPGFGDLAARVHAHGAKVIVQICHHGKTALVDTIEDRQQLVPTVPLPQGDMRRFIADLTMDEMLKMAENVGAKTPSHRQADIDDIELVVEQFADAAQRVQQAGCDGIEVHAAHGYLIATFLSPHWNQRTDDHGGSTENRTRLLRDVVRAIRHRTGEGFVIVVRIDGAEFGLDDGITPELAASHARAAQDAGADAIHVSGYGDPSSGVAFTDGPLPWKPGQYRDLVRPIKAAVDIPVIMVGRLLPDLADEIIASGEADFASMGRQLLADPELPNRLVDGRPGLVRPCINCLVCVAANFWDGTPRCAVNARLGRADAPPIEAAADRKNIAVVGAGPGGMEAARVAATRGHDVTLFERGSSLGGTARFSAVTTPANGDLVRYFGEALDDAGVDVRLGVDVTTKTLSGLGVDRIVVATGARRERPPVPGADLPHVLTGDDLRSMLTGDGAIRRNSLAWWQRAVVAVGRRIGATTPDRVRTLSRRWMPVGRKIVVVGGGLVGVEIAEFLAERGREVTVLEEQSHFATEMAHPRRWRTIHEARSHGVEFVADATVTAITADAVSYTVDDHQLTIPADHVIVASGVVADDSLADVLRSAGYEVDVVGDAAEVGYIEGAIRSGYDLGSSI